MQVALLFLVYGPLPQEKVWASWLEKVEGLVPPSVACNEEATQCLKHHSKGKSARSVYDRQHLYTMYVHTKPDFDHHSAYPAGSIFHGRVIDHLVEVWTLLCASEWPRLCFSLNHLQNLEEAGCHAICSPVRLESMVLCMTASVSRGAGQAGISTTGGQPIVHSGICLQKHLWTSRVKQMEETVLCCADSVGKSFSHRCDQESDEGGAEGQVQSEIPAHV